MASSSSAGPDTAIVLKVNFDGVVKKLKLPLRELGPSSLETKLREQLNIPTTTRCLIERYSDSAASYVVLLATNTSVFKQLYRAAKAKQKLKLRVTTLATPTENKPSEAEHQPEPEAEPRVARPVTVEDVPETTDPKPTSEHIEHVATSAPTAATAQPVPSHNADSVNLLDLSEPSPVVGNAEQMPRSIIETQPKTQFVEPPQAPASQPVSPRAPFAVYCNSCDKAIPDSHYHCSTCDDGDFDLCQGCINMGITCHGDGHWLIKRMIRDGDIVTSTTERKAPKSVIESVQKNPVIAPEIKDMMEPWNLRYTPTPRRNTEIKPKPAPQPPKSLYLDLLREASLKSNFRTCNNCVKESPEHDFLHCTTCDDFDLCKDCFVGDSHGHHPRHAFVAADGREIVDGEITSRLAPGRNQRHNALCDGCDQYIRGVRHKCLNCPDWDYCSKCVVNADFIHPGHRFVPVYEPLRDVTVRQTPGPVHFGIHCDGPLCQSGTPRFIIGVRYKCAVCHDTDFCANCEACPTGTHNQTHPLIKFKTPVRGVNVTTTGQHENGKRMPVMGDRMPPRKPEPARKQTLSPSTVQTVVNVKPVTSAPAEVAKPAEKTTEELVINKDVPAAEPAAEYCAVFERDTISDGTVMAPNHIFEQTWVLRNAGTQAWPAGCCVKYIGGDYMGHVVSTRPAGVQELISASESTICYAPLAPGQSFHFTVLLRTPPRDGKIISYWRLTTPDGHKFGHRLWCDVEVKTSAEDVPETPVVKEEPKKSIDEASDTAATSGSQMIFPKLEKESPVASVHQDSKPETREPSVVSGGDLGEFDEDEEWNESEEGFMTDEEYDILDASDEEYVIEPKKPLKK